MVTSDVLFSAFFLEWAKILNDALKVVGNVDSERYKFEQSHFGCAVQSYRKSCSLERESLVHCRNERRC